MDKLRRQKLTKIQEQIEKLKVELDTLRGEEEQYRDSMPETMYNSEPWQIADEAVCLLQDAARYLEDAIYDIEAAK